MGVPDDSASDAPVGACRGFRCGAWRFLCGAALAAAIVLPGCSNDGSDLLPEEVLLVPGGEVSLSREIQPVFDSHCAVTGCHAGPFPEQGMSLERGNLFDPVTGIVGVPSAEVAGMDRVEPGSAERSYLVHKIQGTQISVGGAGAQMPFGATPLSTGNIEAIRAWIDQGARDN